MRINKSLITYIPTSGAGSGTVTSVALSATMPTGLTVSISGSPITSSGTLGLTLTFTAGYSIPTTVKQSNWDDAYTFVAAFPSQTGQVGKYLTTDGSTLSWGTPSSVNIYNANGTLTGNRLVTGSGYFLQFDANIGIGKNPSHPLDVNGIGAFTSVLTGNIINTSNPIYIYTINDPSNATYGRIGFSYSSIIHTITSDGAGGASRDLGLMAGGAGGQLYLGTSGSNKWQITGSYNVLGSGHLLPSSDTIYNIGDTAQRVWKFYGVKSYISTNLQIGGSLSEYNSSLLTMEATNKGFLPPRMTSTQRAAISLPQIGLVVYQTNGDEGLWQFTNGSGWQYVGGAFTGTVTSVGLTSSTGGVTITNTPITTSGNINIEIGIASASTDGLLMQSDWTTFNNKMANVFTSLGDMVYSNAGGAPVRRSGNITTTKMFLSQTGDGTISAAPTWATAVTSVALTMPSAFSVTGSPITTTGTLAVSGAGLASQYIRGDGTLADFPTSGGGGSSVSYYLNGSVNQGTLGGNTYYEMSKVAILGAGTDFTIGANGYIAQFITDANDPALLKIPSGNWNFEMYFSASSNGGSPSFYVELSKYNGSTFTAIASSSSFPEFIAFGTTVSSYHTTLAVPETTLSITDRLAIRVYVVHSGRTITLHTEDNHLSEIFTTFSTGLNALNGLTTQVQYFAVGTSGSDFNISSVTDTHTFNLPSASASVRGALLSADWTTFNGKMANVFTSLGDMVYSNAGGAPVRRSGNITTTKMFLSQTGDGTTSAAPQWSAVTAADVSAVPTSRTLTINDVAFDLTANRSWSVGDYGTW